MPDPLMITLITAAINLGGMLVILSFMAFFLTRLNWGGRGMIAMILTIVVAALFWMVPAMVALVCSIMRPSPPDPISLCFGNWLISAVAIVLFSRTAPLIPRCLEDSARLDGCGWFGIYWHVVLPLVRRDVGYLAILLIMASTLPLWAALSVPGKIDFASILASLGMPTYSITGILAFSALSSLPIIAIFLFTHNGVRSATNTDQTSPLVS